jgi:hypothetical protein
MISEILQVAIVVFVSLPPGNYLWWPEVQSIVRKIMHVQKDRPFLAKGEVRRPATKSVELKRQRLGIADGVLRDPY